MTYYWMCDCGTENEIEVETGDDMIYDEGHCANCDAEHMPDYEDVFDAYCESFVR